MIKKLKIKQEQFRYIFFLIIFDINLFFLLKERITDLHFINITKII